MIYKNEDIEFNKKNNHLKLLLIGIPILIILVIVIYSIFLILYSLRTPERDYVFGMKAYIVETSSMEPDLKIGDVIIIKKVRTINDLKPGDIITFKSRGETITHRIQTIDTKNETMRTKGDKNSSEDIEEIDIEDIIGIKVLKLPKFEITEIIVRHGMYWVIIIMIILTIFLHRKGNQRRSMIRRRKKRIEDKKNEKSKINF